MADLLDFDSIRPYELQDSLPETEEEKKRRVEGLPLSDRLGRAGRRFVSAIPANLAMLPALPGLIKAGVDYGTDALFEGEEARPFAEHMQDPITKGMVDVGMAGREAVQEAFGLKGEAYGTLEQLGDILGSSIPIPAGWLGAAGMGTTKLGRAASVGVSLATPVVRSTTVPGHLLRGAGQASVFGGIEQGVRALVDDPEFPLMFSEAALRGTKSIIDFESMAPFGEVPPNEQFVEEQRRMDEAVEEQEDRNTGWIVAGVIASALAGYGGVKYSRHLSKRRYLPAAEGGEFAAGRPERQPKTFVEGVKERYERGKGRVIDSHKTTEQVIAEADQHAPEAMNAATKTNVNNLKTTDTRGVSQEMASGNWPAANSKDLPKGAGFSGQSLHDIEQEFMSLPNDKKIHFIEGMAAYYHKQTAQRSPEATVGLLDHATGRTITESRMNQMIETMFADEQLARMAKEYGLVGEDALKYQHYIANIIGKPEYDAFTAQATLGTHHKKPIYIHGVEAQALPTFLENLSYKMGFRDTLTAESIRDMAFNLSKSADEGIARPLDPFTSMRIYLNVLAHATTEQQLAWSVLSHASLIRGLGFNGKVITRVDDSGRTIPLESAEKLLEGGIRGGPTLPAKDSPVRFMGLWDTRNPVRDGGDILSPRWHGVGDPIARKLTGYTDSHLARVQRAGLHNDDKTLIVSRDGIEYLFYVEPHLKRALEINPELSQIMRFGAFQKGLFQQGTTGVLSMFAPAAAIYNAQLAAMTRGARAGTVPGAAKAVVEANYDTLRGVYEIFKSDASRVWAEFAARSIARHVSQGREAPQILRGLQDRLARSMNSQVLNSIRATSGRSGTGVMNPNAVSPVTAFDGLMANGMPEITRGMGADFAVSMGRTWTAWNRSFHEGTFVGMVIREANRKRGRDAVTGKFQTKSLFDSPEDFQAAILNAKRDVGDVTKHGTGVVARFAHNWVPFSAPTIQSWMAVGSAIKSVGVAKGTALVTGIVGIPTAVEFLSNQFMMLADTDENGELKQYFDGDRFWTQTDYFWNGYGQLFRTNNAIFMIPGQAPWEAAIMNISPEWSLGRSIVIDTLDMFTGFSNVGNKSKVMNEQGHIWAGLARMFDVPMPPVIAASIAATMGVDFRMGVQENITSEDGQVYTFSTARRIGASGGHRATGSAGRYAESFHNERIAKVLEDLFGSLGSAYIAVTDGFIAGYKDDGIFGGLEDAMTAVGDSASGQLRMTQPIFGKAHRNTRGNSINRDLYAKLAVLNDISRTEFNTVMGQGRISFPDGRVLGADSLPPPDDPVYRQLTMSSRDLLKAVKPMQDAINTLQKRTREEGNDPQLSYNERLARRDHLANDINAQRALQLSVLEKWENQMSEVLSQRLGRKVNIDFSKVKARRRPNIGEGVFGGRPPTGHSQFNR